MAIRKTFTQNDIERPERVIEILNTFGIRKKDILEILKGLHGNTPIKIDGVKPTAIILDDNGVVNIIK